MVTVPGTAFTPEEDMTTDWGRVWCSADAEPPLNWLLINYAADPHSQSGPVLLGSLRVIFNLQSETFNKLNVRLSLYLSTKLSDTLQHLTQMSDVNPLVCQHITSKHVRGEQQTRYIHCTETSTTCSRQIPLSPASDRDLTENSHHVMTTLILLSRDGL